MKRHSVKTTSTNFTLCGFPCASKYCSVDLMDLCYNSVATLSLTLVYAGESFCRCHFLICRDTQTSLYLDFSVSRNTVEKSASPPRRSPLSLYFCNAVPLYFKSVWLGLKAYVWNWQHGQFCGIRFIIGIFGLSWMYFLFSTFDNNSLLFSTHLRMSTFLCIIQIRPHILSPGTAKDFAFHISLLSVCSTPDIWNFNKKTCLLCKEWYIFWQRNTTGPSLGYFKGSESPKGTC